MDGISDVTNYSVFLSNVELIEKLLIYFIFSNFELYEYILSHQDPFWVTRKKIIIV